MHNDESKPMSKNQILYSVAATLVECAKALNSIDNSKSTKLLDIATELAAVITFNEDDEKEIENYESILRE